jgi:tRNA/tmRNA/rRNA uracil-C5-methylase (TrmA/RlmC/RlmD family)
MEIKSNKDLKKFFNQSFDELRKKGELNSNVSKYFGEVGSTDCEDIYYDDQVRIKLSAIKIIFSEFLKDNNLKAGITKSPQVSHYRFKMDYVCSFDPFHEPNNRFGQRKKSRFNWVVDMDSSVLFPDEWTTKSRSIYEFLLENGVGNYDLVKQDGFLRYLVVKQHNSQAMLNLITTSTNNDELMESAAKLALEAGFSSVNWLINNSLSDDSTGEVYKTWGNDYISVEVKVNDNKNMFKVGTHSFFQNNIPAFELILEFISKFIDNSSVKSDTLYDLYCGVGLIGQSFANLYKKVIGFDINEENIKFAKENAILNKLDNTYYEIYDLSSGQQHSITLEKNQTVVVDPPRTGLMKGGVEQIMSLDPKRIIYISCNPVTQLTDIQLLKDKYTIKAIQAFDLFPQTYHLENVVILDKLA